MQLLVAAGISSNPVGLLQANRPSAKGRANAFEQASTRRHREISSSGQSEQTRDGPLHHTAEGSPPNRGSFARPRARAPGLPGGSRGIRTGLRNERGATTRAAAPPCRSAHRSAMSSSPTEMRSRPGAMPKRASSFSDSVRRQVAAGYMISDSDIAKRCHPTQQPDTLEGAPRDLGTL